MDAVRDEIFRTKLCGCNGRPGWSTGLSPPASAMDKPSVMESVCVGGWERAERADTTERLVYPEAINLMVNKFKVVASASAASLISNTCKYTENGLSYLIQTLSGE